jgi:hypothetical protein
VRVRLPLGRAEHRVVHVTYFVSAERRAECVEVAFEELLPTLEEYEPILEVEDEASDV